MHNVRSLPRARAELNATSLKSGPIPNAIEPHLASTSRLCGAVTSQQLSSVSRLCHRSGARRVKR